MDMHFEYGRNGKAHLRDRIQLCDAALAFIDEQRQLLKLLRANPVSEYGNKAFNAPLKRLMDLDRFSHDVGLAFRGRVAIEHDRGGSPPELFAAYAVNALQRDSHGRDQCKVNP